MNSSSIRSYLSPSDRHLAVAFLNLACFAVPAVAQAQWSASYASSTPTFGESSAVLDNGFVVVGDPGFTTGTGARVGQAMIFAPGNPTALRTYTGTAHFSEFGSWVGQVGDVNNDGRNDWVISESSNNKVWVVSGAAPFNLVYPAALVPPSIAGTTGMQGFGSRVVSVGDLNGDSFDDLAISAPVSSGSTGQGFLFVFITQSAASMTFRYSLTIANGASAMHGNTNLGADLAFDAGTSVLVAGAPMFLSGSTTLIQEGAVASFFLNATGVGLPAPRIVQMPVPTNDQFGQSVACLGDLDNDQWPEWVSGANLSINGANNVGRIAYRSTATGTFSFYSAVGQTQFRLGYHVRRIEDVDSDGLADIVSNDVFGNLSVISSRLPHAAITTITGHRLTKIGTGPNIADLYQNGATAITISGVTSNTAFVELINIAGSMSRGGGCATQGTAPVMTCQRPVLSTGVIQLNVTTTNPAHANQLGLVAMGTTAPGQYASSPFPFCAGQLFIGGGATLAFVTSPTGSYPQSLAITGLPAGFCLPIQAGVLNGATQLFDLTNGVFITTGNY